VYKYNKIKMIIIVFYSKPLNIILLLSIFPEIKLDQISFICLIVIKLLNVKFVSFNFLNLNYNINFTKNMVYL